MTVAAFVPGMMDRSRFDPFDVVFVADGVEAEATMPTRLLVDLDRCDDPAQFRLPDVEVIGFGSHVNDHHAAEQAGFDRVLPRSVFFRSLAELAAN